jgi:hypothetical protein
VIQIGQVQLIVISYLGLLSSQTSRASGNLGCPAAAAAVPAGQG